MSWYVQFLPIAPPWLIWVIGLSGLFMAVVAVLVRGREGLTRLPFLVLLILMLMGPSFREEDAIPLRDIVAVIVDESPSQDISARAAQSDAALSALTKALEETGEMEVRTQRTGGRGADDRNETRLFEALDRLIADVPPDRLAGVILITDGQIHDVPKSGKPGGLDTPVHALLTGRRDLGDRKLTISSAPAFGIVGQRVGVKLRVEDLGVKNPGRFARLEVRLNGESIDTRSVIVGEEIEVPVRVPHAGSNILEIVAEEGPEELTLLNNRAALVISGVRDRLKVLLVSGEPHAGQRTWRNLLKSDPAVDLVHFTILRPPGKRDFARPNELSLIEFPTDELFNQKLYEFDLVIFDRFRQRNVLNLAYFSNMARYVEQGGALLVAAGPAFATQVSLFETPLAAVLPVSPTGDVIEKPYKPHVSDAGRRHPVTAGLPSAGAENTEPEWGRWFRLISAEARSGQVLMQGPDGRPLLLLDRYEKGRVAMLLSDHAWLWARGFEGGGPQQELLRRVGHWLMKEPELEEEDLSAVARGKTLEITRRSMADEVPPVTLTTPSGKETTVTLEPGDPGIWQIETDTDEVGLYSLSSGRLKAVVAVGAIGGKEFADVRTSEEPLKPVLQATGGGAYWVAPDGGTSVDLPDIRHVRKGRDTAGRGWLGLVDNNRFEVRSTRDVPLLPPFVWAVLLIGTLVFAWRFEAR